MLTSVRPSFNDDLTTIQMTVLGRRSEDIDEFMEKLEATGAFDSVLPAQRDTTDEGLDRLLLKPSTPGRWLRSQPPRYQQERRRRRRRSSPRPRLRNPGRRSLQSRRPRNLAAPPAEVPADDRSSPDRARESPHRLHPARPRS